MKKIFDFLLSRREGRFLVIGTILMLTGFIVNTSNHTIANLFFYGAMFFLGYFAAKEAVVETIKEKSPNVDLLMVTAALGAALIDYASEGALLLFIFALSGLMEDYANGRSTASIEELMGQVPDTAQLLLESGEVREVPTEELKVGDRVVVSRGDQIPIDGEVDRPVQINEAALTGESVPVHKEAGDEVFAGTINDGHAFELTVTTPPEETVFSNIIRMVEEAQNRPSRVATFIDKIESKYVIGVLIAVPIFIALLYYGQGLPFEKAFYRGMVFLTVASPCALVASATPATLSAISNGASNGILTKGGAALEALSDMGVLFTDKTGTLTYGNFSVVDYEIEDELLKEVVHMESNSAHPIAEALVNHFNDLDLSTVDRNNQVEEVAGVGLRKGDIQVGKPSAFQDYEDPHSYLEKADSNHTVIFVTEGRQVKGYFTLADQIRPSAQYAVENFQKDGVDVQILTGDSESVTKEVADTLGIKEYHAALMPQEKTVFVEKAQEESDDVMVGMIGDGINDAPALATADIGVAMGEGSSVAMESADLVIVQNDLGKLYYNYRLSQRLSHIIKQNVIFAVGVMAILIILNFFGLISLPIAVLCHEGSTILVILNGLRLLRKEEDSINDDGQGQEIGQTSHA